MNITPLRSMVVMAVLALAPGLSWAQEPNPVPQTFHTIYPNASAAHAEVAKAIQQAAAEHKRVLLDFGNYLSPDCQVLDGYLALQPNATQIADHFVLVRINVGKTMKQNLDLAQKFGVPIAKGVPALAVVDGNGQVIHAQADGEFQHARNMSADDVTVFLNKWRS